MIRLFVNESFKREKIIELLSFQSHYLVHVMRLKEGDEIICFNGNDGDWTALLTKQKKQWCLLLQKQVLPQQKRSRMTLCLSLIKREPLAYALQKATELGVTEIHLIQAERSNRERVNMERLHTVIQEACEQCERNDIPQIFAPKTLQDVINNVADKNCLILLSERGKTSGKKTKLPPAFFIGPEGGWTEKEQKIFQENQAISWHLGNTILRAETAALTVLALWQYKDEIKMLAI